MDDVTIVRHRDCGHVAFRVRGSVDELFNPGTSGVVLNSRTVVYDDGRRLIDDDGTGLIGDLIRCQCCGRVLAAPFVRQGDEALTWTDGWVEHVREGDA